MVSPSIHCFQGLARMGAVTAHQYMTGLNPFTKPIHTPCVHNRFLTADERRKQQRLHQSDFEVAHLSSLIETSTRRNRNKQIGRNICLLFNRIAAEELREEQERTREEREEWKADALEHAVEVSEKAMEMRDCENALNSALVETKKMKEQRDKLCSMLQTERGKAEAAESCRQVAIRSLRNRWKSEKQQLEEEVRTREEMLRQKEWELSEVKSFADESVEHLECQEKTVATLENEGMVKSVSRQLSMALSEMSDVSLVRTDVEQSVGDKMRDLRDGVRDLVKEVRSRRENATRLTERIFKMEEERLMWALDYRTHEAEMAELRGLLDEANAVIAAGVEGRSGSRGEG